MKTMKLILLAILFTASLHAQNDTAYFDDGSMVIGKGGIKVSIEDENIVIDGSGINNGVKPGITAEPSTGKGVFSWRVWPDTVDWGTGVRYVDDFEWTSATTKLHEVPHPMHINNPKNGDVKIIPDGEESGMYVFYDKIWYKIPE